MILNLTLEDNERLVFNVKDRGDEVSTVEVMWDGSSRDVRTTVTRDEMVIDHSHCDTYDHEDY